MITNKQLQLEWDMNQYFERVRHGARIRSIIILVDSSDLMEQFLKQDARCALTGLALRFNTQKNSSDGNASLDRIDSSEGYVRGNIQWIHKDVNIMKRDHKQEYFIKMCTMIADKCRNPFKGKFMILDKPPKIRERIIRGRTYYYVDLRRAGNLGQQSKSFNRLDLALDFAKSVTKIPAESDAIPI